MILWRADGNAPPQWPIGINLNTIVAFMASLAKVTFVVAIVEGLGQLKWMWFASDRPRPLIDFQIFDEAAKGGMGSLKLLFRFKGALASFGALILLSGLMTSTFTQMAIAYPVILAESKNGSETASVERATTFSVYNGDNLNVGQFEAVRQQQAVYNGGFYPPNMEAPHIAPACSSGECSWPAYGSLAVCSDVVNLTAHGSPALLDNLRSVTSERLQTLYSTIERNGDVYEIDDFLGKVLPRFYPVILGPMDSPSNAFNTSVNSLTINDNFVAYPMAIMNASAPLDMTNFHFLEVAFWWCTKTFESKVTSGKHKTTETASRSEPKPHQKSYNNTETLNMAWSHVFYPCYVAGTCNATYGAATVELEAPPLPYSTGANDTYAVHVWTGLTVSGLLAATMWDSVLMDPSHGVVTSNGGGIAKAFALSVLGDFMATYPSADTQLKNAKNIARNIGRALTNLVRQEASYFTSTAEPLVNGTVFTPQPFVRIHWGWISVLSLQLGLASLFLLLTMLSTAKGQLQVLKSSNLVTLCALQPDGRERLDGLRGFDQLGRRARGTRVKLVQGKDGRAVWLAIADTHRSIAENKSDAKGAEVVAAVKIVEDDDDAFRLRRHGRIFGDQINVPEYVLIA